MAEYMNYLEKLHNDIIEQFKDKPNTYAVLKAFARQFDDLYAAFYQLMILRRLDNAQGKQLDGIGDIVVLSRIQATNLERIRVDHNVDILDDDTYRIWLRYKMFLNAFDGTYKDFIRNIRMFWEETILYYSENLERPATIFLDTPDIENPFDPEGLFNIPLIKPAGVQIVMRANTTTPQTLNLKIGGYIKGVISSTTLPQMN